MIKWSNSKVEEKRARGCEFNSPLIFNRYKVDSEGMIEEVVCLCMCKFVFNNEVEFDIILWDDSIIEFEIYKCVYCQVDGIYIVLECSSSFVRMFRHYVKLVYFLLNWMFAFNWIEREERLFY